MKRFLGWMAVGTALLLSACGGSVQSPDFEAQLVGIQISPATNNVDVGATTQFKAAGLYSTPPGTSGGVTCATGICTVGSVSGVTWSVKDAALASVDNNGNVKGLRRGSTNVIAEKSGFSATGIVTIGGVVLQNLIISPSTASVAAGRTQTFSVQGQYSDGTTGSVNQTVNWTVNNANVATVSPAQGSSTTAASKIPGEAIITASTVNSEGDTKSQTVKLTVTAAVLDQLQITPSSISIPKGTTASLDVRGIYSDSSTARQVVEDVAWSVTDTTLGSVSPANTTGGNNATVVTASTTNAGSTFIRAQATNSEGVVKSASANFSVIDAALTAVTAITPANPTVAQGTTQLFKAVGTFTNAPSTPVELDSNQLDFSSSATGIATIDNADNAQGANTKGTATAVSIGTTTITAALKSGSYPSVTQRSASTTMTVGDAFCRVQYTQANATTAAPSPGATCLSATTGSCTVTNPNNVISSSSTDAASFNIAPALAAYTLVLDVKQSAATAVTPVAGQRAGFLIGIGANSSFNPSTDLKLSTIASDGTIQETAAPTVQNLNKTNGSDNLMLVYIPVTKAFVGVRASVSAAGALTLPTGGLSNPITTLQSLLNNGGSVVVNAYSACSTLVPNP